MDAIQFYKPVHHAVKRDLQPVLEIQLLIDVTQVVANGMLRDLEGLANFPIRLSPGDTRQHLGFARGEIMISAALKVADIAARTQSIHELPHRGWQHSRFPFYHPSQP